MSWTYNPTLIGTDTSAKRLNAVRLLIGDTDYSDQQLQDEEVTFALSETQDNVYFAGSWCCTLLSAKYARRVDTDLDGQLSEKYSQLQQHYKLLSQTLLESGKRYDGNSLGVKAGGIRVSQINSVRDDTNRVTPDFRTDRFKYPQGDYLGDYTDE